MDFNLEANKFQKQVVKEFSAFKILEQKLENGCIQKNSKFKLSLPQQFISNYFTPSNPNGLFIFHGIGSGKTLTGVNLVSHFQQKNFNVLWVTRRTLIKDIDKAVNMLKTNPFVKLSYKQFSNVCKRKGNLYESIIKRNRKIFNSSEIVDPLYRTLVIIDEAHKLYGNDLKAQEKHDIKAIEEALFDSYNLNQNRARLVLMSATPISDDPIELIKTMNLLITNPKDRFDTSKFYDDYISENGSIVEIEKFNEKTKGIVSYLDVSNNYNVFAKTKNVNISIPISVRGVPEKRDCKFLKTVCKEIGMSIEVCEIDYDICKEKNEEKRREYKKLVFQNEKLDACLSGTSNSKPVRKK